MLTSNNIEIGIQICCSLYLKKFMNKFPLFSFGELRMSSERNYHLLNTNLKI